MVVVDNASRMAMRWSPRHCILSVLFACTVAAPAAAQMDMLPQIFRDLPPEIEQGLPVEMSYAEYRELNRNIDFFTMFMGLFVPGYGLFTVERPDLAWPMVGVRVAGYGMMSAAVALQWDNFQDIGNGDTLPETAYRRLITNSFLFGGGAVVAGLSWAADIGLAYHIAKEERDFVQYRYGVRATVSTRERDEQAADEAYLRQMVAQPADPLLDTRLSSSLLAHATRYPDSDFAGAALYFAAMLLAEREEDIEALGPALRSAYLYPSGERADDSIRLAALLFERNTGWRRSFEVASLVTTGSELDARSDSADIGLADADSRLLSLSTKLIQAETEEFTRLGIDQAQALLVLFPDTSLEVPTLTVLAEGSLQLGESRDAAQYLAMITLRHPENDLWAPSTLALAELYRDDLRDPEREEVLLRAIIENAPQSREAAEAQRRLSE